MAENKNPKPATAVKSPTPTMNPPKNRVASTAAAPAAPAAAAEKKTETTEPPKK